MMGVPVSDLSLKIFGYVIILSWGDTKSESDCHYCQDLAMEFLDEQDIWGAWLDIVNI